MTSSLVRRRILGFWLAGLLLLGADVRAADVVVMTSGGFTAPLLEVIPEFERASGHKVITVFGASTGGAPDSIPVRLARGEAADLVILTAESLDALTGEGRLVPGTRTDLVRSRIGMAVRAGAPRPDISTVDALVRTLRQARSVAYSASASGTYLSTELFPRLGLSAQMKEKGRRIVSERVGAVVARGDAEIGFQQISELLPIQGIDYVGPLPDEVQRVSTFSVALASGATHQEAARSLIAFLTSSAVLPAIRKFGLDPAQPSQRTKGRTGSEAPWAQLRIVAPAAPGGGWDQTARVMQQVLQRAGLVRTAPVENIPGAAGTIGLARFMGAERGRDDTVMVSGLIMLGGIVTHQSPVTLSDVTPIARLTGEYEVIAVPAASPFRSLSDLIAALEARPESISWGGGSAGGSDQMLAGLVAEAVGVAPRRLNYVAFSGGGESLSAIVGGQVSVGVNGLAEFAPHLEAGTLRALGISSASRLPGLDVPTLLEQGVNVEFENWRSIVAPPGISRSDRRRLEGLVERMTRTAEWQEALARYRWLDRYLAGPALDRFVATEEARVTGILRELGTGQSGAADPAASGPYPLLILAGLAMSGLATIVVARRARATAGGWPAWKPIALVAAGIALNVLLLERSGFPVASAVLFWCTARAFDARHPVRDAAVAVAVSLAAYLVFSHLLQLQLPAGQLGRWL
ncbi:MAG TPA: tripartite tricarboxylate transporter substrate-binding protein [Vicinamibacterales bacterium]|nr:tripartite tricarboxylate transporter substrate-binding protein [Vicinamibacterales bacterium]